MEQLPDLDPITRLSPQVIRILGGNPSKYTLQGTNTYLIGTGPRRILLDTGEGKSIWSQTLQQALHEEKASIDRILLSHWHPDHVGGVAHALSLPSCEGAKVYKSQLDRGQAHIADGSSDLYDPTSSSGQEDIVDGQVFETEGATLTAFHTPGHTVDHMAFVLHEENAMFTADNVLGHGTAVFEDLAAYMASLQKMGERYSSILQDSKAGTASSASAPAYPGHGAVITDGPGKIKEYISHRKEREQQILAVLRDRPPQPQDGSAGWKSMSIVKIIYKEYPEHLHQPAERSVLQVLKKMEGDGEVRKNEGGGWTLTKKAAL